MTKSRSLYLILLLFWGQFLQGQLDPRIASVLGNLSTQQKQMLASSVGMMNQRTNQKPDAGIKEDEDALVTDEDSDKSKNELQEEEKEEDTLQQLLFLEQLLLNDLNALEEKQKKEDEIEELSTNDQLRMIESLEQTKRLI